MARTKNHRRTYSTGVMTAFKKVTRKKRKKKEKQAIKNKDFESVPPQKKTDKYDFY